MKYFSFKKIIFCLLLTTVFFVIQTNNVFAFWNPISALKSTVISTVEVAKDPLSYIVTNIGTLTLKVLQIIFEYFWIPISDYIVALGGKLLNYSIEFTIFSAYGSSGTNPLTAFDTTIKEIWVIIRDTINIVFIFTLLYIAIKRILGDFKKDIFVGVLASAIFVNFSFFITRTVIDMGNIVTSSIYNQIEIKAKDFNLGKEDGMTDSILASITGTESTIKLSEILRSVVGTDSVDKLAVFKNFDFAKSRDAVGSAILRFIMLQVLGFVFLLMSFLLLGRFVMLIFLMASSPIGFLFESVPQVSKYAKSWWSNLINQVAIAPIFMFFMLIVINISQNDALKKARENEADVGLFFNYILMISLLIYSVKITKKMGGQVTAIAGKATSFVAGVAMGAVTGGTAMLGRQTVGRLAAKTASGAIGARLQQSAAKGGFAGGLSNLALKGIKGTANASFDTRGSKIIQGSVGQMKSLSGGAIDIKGAMDSVGNFGKASGDYGKDKKGFTGWKEKQKEDVIKKSQEYDEAANKTEKAAELKAQNKYQVIEKRIEEEKAKKEWDKAENDLATASAADKVAKETERDRIKMEYLAKKGAREVAEQNTEKRIKNDAETRFEDDGYVSVTSDVNKKNYRDAQTKIEDIRKRQTNNKTAFDATIKSKKDKEKYSAEEAKLQEELKVVVEEMEKAKEAGIKSQIDTVEKEILKQNKPEDQGVIKIIKTRQMRKDYAKQLRKQIFTLNQFSRIGTKNFKLDFEETEREELAKLVESDKGASKVKSEEEKTMAALLKQLEKLNDKK